MNISSLDLNDIEYFALAYSVAEQVFDIEPIKATPKKQKKIRKWLNKAYLAGFELSDDAFSFVEKTKTDFEVMKFLSECNTYINEQNTIKQKLFDEATTDFSEDVREAFDYLFKTVEYCDDIEIQENKIIIPLESCDSYSRRLILHTSLNRDFSNFDFFNFKHSEIIKEADSYKLACTAESLEWDTSTPVNIDFNYATVEMSLYRADRTDFGLTPWDTLISIACNILSKRDLGEEYFNQKECEIMPLIKELSQLSAFSRLSDEESPSFDNLKQYIRKHNLSKIIPLLDKAASNYKNLFSRQMHLIRLTNKLNDKACEKLWRELYDLIVDSQRGYDDKIISYDQKLINKIRLQTENNFHKLGYEGKYPTFRKKGVIKGIKLEESYHQTYFVGLEKNVEHIVHCTENVYSGMLQIEFLCGTALLKKNESITDIYSCCFNARGRRFFKSIYLYENVDSDIDIFERLEQYTQIAAKRAECIKLNKNELELIGNDFVPWLNFLNILFFAGGLFGILMTLSFIIFVSLITAIEEGFSAVPETIGMIPWWLIFIFCALGFGIPMAIIDTKAKTK